MVRRVCVVGGGVSGLGAAWLLNRSPDVDLTVLEKGARLGGHANAVLVRAGWAARGCAVRGGRAGRRGRGRERGEVAEQGRGR
jgi:predicted NAD/FAD-binding protein